MSSPRKTANGDLVVELQPRFPSLHWGLKLEERDKYTTVYSARFGPDPPERDGGRGVVMTRRGVISERKRFHAISLGPIKPTRLECSISRAERISEKCGRKACSMITRATDRRYRVITGSIFRTKRPLAIRCGNLWSLMRTSFQRYPARLHERPPSADSPQSLDYHPIAVTPFFFYPTLRYLIETAIDTRRTRYATSAPQSV